LVFHHDGHKNVQAVIGWVEQTFTTIPQLLVTGCSAGGTSSVVNYHFIRKGLSGVQCSYMLDDSGPLFPSTGNSGPLHQKVRDSWNLDPVIDEAIASDFPGVSADDVKADLSLINTALADKYPRDRLAIAMYQLDYNYSLYSYERFHDAHTQADIHRMWWEDIQLLMEQFDSRENLGYFIPYFRNDNCSHCITIPPVDSNVLEILATPYKGSEIQESNLNIRDYVEHLVDDSQPLESYLEGAHTDGSLSPERAAECSAL
jgi:acetyl esterase/lipase